MASSPTAFLPLFQPVEQRLYQKARGYVLHMERLSARASENVETIDESELLFEKNLKVEKIVGEVYLMFKFLLTRP